jgi:gluconolactonase
VERQALNSRNHAVVKSADSIWFTDPTYGIDADYEGDRADREIDGCHVYRVDAKSGAVTAVVIDMVRPNGIAFSPDEKYLYVVDTGARHKEDGPRHIRRFRVDASARPFVTTCYGKIECTNYGAMIRCIPNDQTT